VRDPRGVAAELVERAQAFDTLDARDAAEEAAAAAVERSALGRARSFAAGLRGRISRQLRAAARRPAE
jgi:hypothetical protein